MASSIAILIVEDESIVALNYASILEEAGYQVVGPVGTIERGIEAIASRHIDGAVLDIDIGGVPIANEAAAFPDLVGPYNDAVFLEKPCTATQLIKAVNALVVKVRNTQGDFDPAT